MNLDYLNAPIQFALQTSTNRVCHTDRKNSQPRKGYLSAAKGAFEIQPPPSKISAFFASYSAAA